MVYDLCGIPAWEKRFSGGAVNSVSIPPSILQSADFVIRG